MSNFEIAYKNIDLFIHLHAPGKMQEELHKYLRRLEK